MLAQLVDMFRLNAEEKGLSFVYDVPADLPHIVSGDQKRLRQILLNILGNAIKFTQQGSIAFEILDLGLQIKDVEGNKSQISNLKFKISDTGVGIAAEHLERIFQPFQQANPYQLQEGSTGLGLAISQRLVEMMGGRLQVVSTEGQGSTFWFDMELPVIETTRQYLPQSKPGEPPAQKTQTSTLAGLPADWLAALKRAAEETDVEALFEVIGQIREREETIAENLARLVDGFEYDKILALLQQSEENNI
jgi:hypothetical protein